MPRGKGLKSEEKIQIDAFREAGWSYDRIAKRLGRSKGSVQDYVSKRRGYGQKKRKGQPKKLSKRQERQISRLASNSTKSTATIKRELDLNVPNETVRRAIHRNPNLVRKNDENSEANRCAQASPT